MLSSHLSKNEDVIAAIATAHGQGAIGIVRLSGKNALKILTKIFAPRHAKFESRKMYYGKIHRDGEVIDEVMVCYFKSPNSFTCEDSVEIYGHGGMFVLGEILSVVTENGARLAEPGEFTKRAFLNGRINMSQAEAVMDLISSKNNAAQRAALRQLGGGLSRRIIEARDKIISWLAHIELSIDYPEHEEEARNADEILSEGGALIEVLYKLYETANTGKVIREGVRTVIIGRPNVGKSAILNAILKEDRAIVHEIAGTTRDILTEDVRVFDTQLVITDTAGLRETNDPIEMIGIEKTYEAAEDADLILYVANAAEGLTPEDIELIIKFNETAKIIVLLNKCDLLDTLPPTQPFYVNISAKTGFGLEELFNSVQELFLTGNIGAGGESDIITRERHKLLLEKALHHIEKAMNELCDNVTEDLVSISLRAAYDSLGEILGKQIGDDIVERIFSEFCVGK